MQNLRKKFSGKTRETYITLIKEKEEVDIHFDVFLSELT